MVGAKFEAVFIRQYHDPSVPNSPPFRTTPLRHGPWDEKMQKDQRGLRNVDMEKWSKSSGRTMIRPHYKRRRVSFEKELHLIQYELVGFPIWRRPMTTMAVALDRNLFWHITAFFNNMNFLRLSLQLRTICFKRVSKTFLVFSTVKKILKSIQSSKHIDLTHALRTVNWIWKQFFPIIPLFGLELIVVDSHIYILHNSGGSQTMHTNILLSVSSL